MSVAFPLPGWYWFCHLMILEDSNNGINNNEDAAKRLD